MRRAILTLALLAGPALAQEELPEGYPWKMGDMTVTLDGKALPYTTYDFSIGAFDASVQFRDHWLCPENGSCTETGKALLVVGGYPGANPDAKADVVFVKAIFERLPDGPAETTEATVEIRDFRKGATGSWMSTGPVLFTLKAVKRGLEGSDSYGRLEGSVTARLCEAVDEVLVEGGACKDFSAEFTSRVQYDSI